MGVQNPRKSTVEPSDHPISPDHARVRNWLILNLLQTIRGNEGGIIETGGF
jgi:hypothetical protein